MKLLEFHTNLSERHMQVMDSFAQREEYGTRRKVLERGLELLEALDKVEIRELLEAYKIRKSLLEIFGFILIHRDLLDGLAKVAIRESSMETFLEKIRERTLAESKIAQKVLAKPKANSFKDMAESIIFYHKHLNIIGKVHINEEQQQIFARLNTFKSVPEIPLEFLNVLLESLGYSFNLKLEDGENPLFTITWISPENYPEIKEQREKYIKSKHEALITKRE